MIDWIITKNSEHPVVQQAPKPSLSWKNAMLTDLEMSLVLDAVPFNL